MIYVVDHLVQGGYIWFVFASMNLAWAIWPRRFIRFELRSYPVYSRLLTRLFNGLFGVVFTWIKSYKGGKLPAKLDKFQTLQAYDFVCNSDICPNNNVIANVHLVFRIWARKCEFLLCFITVIPDLNTFRWSLFSLSSITTYLYIVVLLDISLWVYVARL